MYNDAAEKVDELAERILMLGGVPVNKFSEYLKVAKVKEVSGVSCADEALETFWTLTASLLPKNVNYFFGFRIRRRGDSSIDERLPEGTGKIGLDVSGLLFLRL